MKFKTTEEREKVIIENMDLVETLSIYYSKETGIDVHELEGYGYEGLIKAIDRYDINLKQNFRNYLYTNVKRSIIRGTKFINNYYKHIKEALNQHKEDIIYSEINITGPIEYDECISLLDNSISNTLSEKEQLIINKYYGLNGEKRKNFTSIGREQGYTKQHAHKVEKRALHKLAQNMDYYKDILEDIDIQPVYIKRK